MSKSNEDIIKEFDELMAKDRSFIANSEFDRLLDAKDFLLKTLQAKDKAHQEEKRRILDGIPCEYNNNCGDDCYNILEEQVKAYRDKELNNL